MPQSSDTRIRRSILPLLAVLAAAALAGCGGSGGTVNPPPDYAKALAGSPPRLAALHDQADELLDGGQAAFDARMKELEGFPVVVNVWASWCGPCRAEFPHFQEASADMGKRIAFVGVNSEDDADAAATFLADSPLSYPSYFDPDKAITNSLDVTHGLPGTAFFDAEGERTFVKHGQYPSQEALEADIERYAVNGGD